MRGFAEFGIFFAIATASHFAVFQPERTGAPEAMGDEGAQMLTLAASSASLTALVQAWERPVDVLQQVAMPEVAMPEAADAPVVRPEASAVPVQPQAMQLAMQEAVQQAPDLPTIDTANPTQPGFAAVQSARPKLRPPAAPRAVAAKPAAQKKAVSQKTSNNTKREVAAGTGKGKAAGQKKKAKTAAKPQASSPAAMARWGGGIRSAIERRKTYPANTRARGRVVLAVAVSTNGRLASVRIKRSSGNRALDNAALSAVKRARFQPAPGGIKSGVHHFSLPISFSR